MTDLIEDGLSFTEQKHHGSHRVSPVVRAAESCRVPSGPFPIHTITRGGSVITAGQTCHIRDGRNGRPACIKPEKRHG